MLNICLAKQRKDDTDIIVYDGSEIMPIVNGIANKVIVFNQFYEYCTHGYWIADNITEQQFEELYNNGQRVFYFQNSFENIVLFIKEWKPEPYEVDQNFKKDKEELFEDVIIQAQNYLDGVWTKEEFRRFIGLANEFLINKNKNNFLTEMVKIEDAAYERLQNK